MHSLGLATPAFFPSFDNFFLITGISWAVSLITYFSMAGFLHFCYYTKPHLATEWKCQPSRWLTKDNERHEIAMGTCNLLLGATVSGILVCGITNNGMFIPSNQTKSFI